jgi:hypothetical protein
VLPVRFRRLPSTNQFAAIARIVDARFAQNAEKNPHCRMSGQFDLRHVPHSLRLSLADRRWFNEIITGGKADAEQIAIREKCGMRHVYMTISLAFLSPTLVKAAVDGSLPRGIGSARQGGPPSPPDVRLPRRPGHQSRDSVFSFRAQQL